LGKLKPADASRPSAFRVGASGRFRDIRIGG
jgi:hypothetical protein